jgi:uncharacterized protein DUF4389
VRRPGAGPIESLSFPNLEDQPNVYPVTFTAEIPTEGRNRLSTVFRLIFAIPAMIVAFAFGFGSFFATLVAWCAIVFTGRYPEGLYNFNLKALRMNTRVNAYVNLANDEMPPLNGDEDPGYPVQIAIAEPLDKYSRLKTGLRMIVGIPVSVLSIVWGIILGVVVTIAWFAILLTGRLPEGLVKHLNEGLAYSTRAGAYFLLLTEDWPPFSDTGGAVAAGQISASQTQKPADGH